MPVKIGVSKFILPINLFIFNTMFIHHLKLFYLNIQQVVLKTNVLIHFLLCARLFEVVTISLVKHSAGSFWRSSQNVKWDWAWIPCRSYAILILFFSFFLLSHVWLKFIMFGSNDLWILLATVPAVKLSMLNWQRCGDCVFETFFFLLQKQFLWLQMMDGI